MVVSIKIDGWSVKCNPKPIPTTSHDYDFWHDDFDGENGLCGTAASVADAINCINDLIDGYGYICLTCNRVIPLTDGVFIHDEIHHDEDTIFDETGKNND